MNWSKTVRIVILCALLLLVGCYGTYRLLVDRYSDQIDQIVTDLIDDATTGQTPIGSSEPTDASSSAVDGESNTATRGQSTTRAGLTDQTGTGTRAGPGTSASDHQGGTPPSSGGISEQVTSGLTLSAAEQAKAESADELLAQMSTTEKLMVLKTLNRFSPAELLEMYRIYTQGDPEAIAEVKARIKASFSAEDIELIKQMAAKYR